MQKLVWRDTTPYRQGVKNKIATSWTLSIDDNIALNVHRFLGRNDTWFLSVTGMDLMTCNLETNDLEQAKALTITIMITKLQMISDSALSRINVLSAML